MPLKKTEKAGVEMPVVRWANARGIDAWKINGMGARSRPDRQFMIPGGKPFWIEFKRPGEGLTPLQADTIAKMLRNGYDVEVHDDPEEAKRAIQRRLDAQEVPAPRRKVPAI